MLHNLLVRNNVSYKQVIKTNYISAYMYLAQVVKNEDVKSDFYIDIFENIVNNHNLSSKLLVDDAILEAIKVANGSVDIYSISNNRYFLVTTLLQKFKQRLTELSNAQEVPNDVYSEILHLLK
jgi:hypothetical protein